MRLICLTLLGLMIAGCSEPKVDNTRLTSDDLRAMTDKMLESLAVSPAVASRTTDSPLWVITADRVSNMTNDILPQRERWAFMARLRGLLNDSDVMRQRNLVFVMSAEQAAALNERNREAHGGRLTPTHALAATFYSLTNARTQGRSDAYSCAFKLLDLQKDTLLWEDAYDIKRTVLRNKLD